MKASVELPFRAGVGGHIWRLYGFDFETAEGRFRGYLYAISMEHAAAVLGEMKETATLAGEVQGGVDAG